ncbi:hypothetical protein QYQ99_03730 [Comamonas testosteroni]|uniref:hypothetical protein n=1 Tax=Comamonas testosteroni TaxID=285 RepID=UPI00265FE8C8|nr:hypothetical protein [Comamonas testosteroni]WKL16678.1 hypothetical protein QYQ99_03730 [Comamonas testosteroni]
MHPIDTVLHELQHRDQQRSRLLRRMQSQAATAATPAASLNTYFQTELQQALRAMKHAKEQRYAHPFNRDLRPQRLR